MDRSLFPDGALVTTDALVYDSTAIRSQVLTDRRHVLERGVYSGLVITVNPVNLQRIDITAGAGSVVNGERYDIPTVALPNFGALNVPIADTNLGALNFVYAFYTETKFAPMPHETNGQVPDTKVRAAFQIQVLTEAQFNALPLTDPTFTTLAQDRASLLGIVTGTGGALLPSSIEQAPAWRTLKFAVITPPGIPGVAIQMVGDLNPNGTGTIFLDTAGPITLAYQAPGEAGPGPAVTITVEGSYILTSLGGFTIEVYVTPAALPAVNTSMAITISGVYDQRVPRESGVDAHHRSLVGSGAVSPTNPHGTSIDDIAPGFIDEIRNHQRFAHSTGITKASTPGCLLGTILEAATPDIFQVQSPVGADAYYVDGKRLTAVVNNQVVWTDAVPGPNKELYEVYVDSEGNAAKAKVLSFDNLVTNIPGIENQIVYLRGVPAGAHTLSYQSFGPGLGGLLFWDGDGGTLVDPVPASGAYYRIQVADQEIHVFFGDDGAINALAAGTYSDTVTTAASVDGLLRMVVAQVSWTGTSTGFLGYTGNRGITASQFVDVRPFGTLDAPHLRDNYLADVAAVVRDHSPDGVVVGGIGSPTASLRTVANAGLTVDIFGHAVVYVAGKAFTVTGQLGYVVPNNDLTLIYVNALGAIESAPYLDFPLFIFSPKTAEWNGEEDRIRRGAALALVTTSGGVVTSVVDMRRNLSGGNLSVRPWSVGQAIDTYDNYSVEFFDLQAAIIYALASAVGSRDTQELVLVDALLTNPLAISTATSIKIRGGRLWLDGGALSGDAFTITNGQLSFDGVTFLAKGTLTPPVGTSLMNVGVNARLSIRNSVFLLGAQFAGIDGLIHVSDASAESSLKANRVVHANPALDIVRVSVANSVDIDGLHTSGNTALVHASFAVVGGSIKGVSGGVSNLNFIFRASGGGRLSQMNLSDLSEFKIAPAYPNTSDNLRFSNSLLRPGEQPGDPISNITDSLFSNVTFRGGPAPAFTNLTRVVFSGCQHTGATLFSASTDLEIVGMNGGTNMEFTAIVGLRLSGGLSGLLRLSGSSHVVDVKAGSVELGLSAGLTNARVRARASLLSLTPTSPLISNVEVSGPLINDIRLQWDDTAPIVRSNIAVRRARTGSIVVGNTVAGSKLSYLGLSIEESEIHLADSLLGALTPIVLSDFSVGRVTRNNIRGPLNAAGLINCALGSTGTGVGDIDIRGNTILVETAVGLAPQPGWGHPVLYVTGTPGAGTSPSGQSYLIEGNDVVHLESFTNPNPIPLIFALLVGGIVTFSAVKNNRVRFADLTAAVNSFPWVLPNGIAVAGRLALVAAVDSDPVTWGGPATGHGRNIAFTEISSNRVGITTGASTIVALVYDGSTALGTDAKILFNGGAPSIIDAVGALTLGND